MPFGKFPLRKWIFTENLFKFTAEMNEISHRNENAQMAAIQY